MQNVQSGISCVAFSAGLLKPHIVGVIIPFKLGSNRSIVPAITVDGLANVIFQRNMVQCGRQPKIRTKLSRDASDPLGFHVNWYRPKFDNLVCLPNEPIIPEDAN